MAADEHLQRSFDALGARLGDELARQLDVVRRELASSLDEEHGRAAAAAEEAHARALALAADEHEQALERASRAAREEAELEAAERLAAARVEARDEAEREFADRLAGARIDAREESERDVAHRLSAARMEAQDTARAEAMALARAEHEGSDIAASQRLLDAIHTIDRARSLSEILDALVSCASKEAPRVGVLLVSGRHLRAWRFVGFGPTLDDNRDFDVLLADSGMLGDAVGTKLAVQTDTASPAFASLPPGHHAVALPVSLSGEVVAVLYADHGGSDPDGRSPRSAPLEIMALHAARSLEAITAFRTAQFFAAPSAAPSAAVLAAPPPAALAAPPPAPLAAPPPVPSPPAPRPAAPSVSAPDIPRAEEPAPATDREDEEQSARRYARLLISEIKLYHEPDVIAGRLEGNLAERLGGEIARARVLYEKRVPARTRTLGDYFHEELVATLADGDAQLLAKTERM